MAKRPTIEQLAQEAGVSVATVDRVLNKRLPVRGATAARVYEAAKRIGYHASGLIAQRMREELPEIRLGFLLLKTSQPFYGPFAQELEKAVAQVSGIRGSCIIDTVASQDKDQIVAKLEALAKRVSAIAVVAPEHPTLTATVERLKLAGVPVFALLSDFAAGLRQGYVGVQNGKVGRTAAWMISRSARKPGKVVLFVGSHRFYGHELREMGFRAYFRENMPEFTVLDTIVNLEAATLTHEMLDTLCRDNPDLVGCYVAGGGMEGAIAALREMPKERRPVTVCHEITPDSRAALAENILTMVISTPTAAICRELVARMVETVQSDTPVPPSQTFLPFDIMLPESV